MVTTNKSWSDDINNLFSAVDVSTHYRESFYYLLQTFLAANWVVTRSCDSVSAPSASNQILAPANVVWGNGVQVRSWFVVQSPAGWCSVPIYVMIGAENVNTDTSPNTITVRAATSAYTGGSTTTYPTAPTGGQTNSGTSLIFHSTSLMAQWSAWWTADGDVYFGTKPLGTSYSFTSFLAFKSDGGFADGGRGSVRALFWVAVGNTTNALQYSAISSNWRGWRTDGSVLVTTPNLVWTPADVLTFRNARDTYQSFTPALPIYLVNTTSGAEARFYGRWLDVWAIPIGNPAIVVGEIRDGEGTQAKRLVSVGTFYLPTSPASLTAASLYGNVIL